MIHFLPYDSLGGARVRNLWPAQALKERGWYTKVWSYWPSGIDPGDVLIVHRRIEENVPDKIRAYRRDGVTVLYSEDDDLNCIPPGNQWQPSRAQLKRHDEAIAACDGLIVTTDRLAKVYGNLARTWVVRNYLPARIGQHRFYKMANDPTVRVGWAGTTSVHLDDLGWLAPVAQEAVRDALFSSVGDTATPGVLGLHRAEVFPLTMDEDAFYGRMARADIGMVPLLPGPFTEAKSWYKALEYMTLGKPVVVVNLPEQKRLVTQGGFLVDTPQEFADATQLLVHDSGLREAMAHEAKARAEALRLEDKIGEWEDVLLATSPKIPMHMARLP